jgi:hypothetical protein
MPGPKPVQRSQHGGWADKQSLFDSILKFDSVSKMISRLKVFFSYIPRHEASARRQEQSARQGVERLSEGAGCVPVRRMLPVREPAAREDTSTTRAVVRVGSRRGRPGHCSPCGHKRADRSRDHVPAILLRDHHPAPIALLHTPGTVQRAQPGARTARAHTAPPHRQVRLAGPLKDQAILAFERYNTFIKKWAKSRNNLGEGMARMNALACEVNLAKLSMDSLRPPGILASTFVRFSLYMIRF